MAGLVAVVASWSPIAPGDEAHYARALDLYEAQDFRGAAIELKNALQADADNLPARVLLGRVYLDVGLPAFAEEHLEQARRAGADPALVIEPLGQALLAQEKYGAVLHRLQPGRYPRAVAASAHTLRARAYLGLGDEERARREIERAVALAPDDVDTGLTRIELLLREDRQDEAEAVADRLLARHPEAAELWFRKGELRRAAGDPVNADRAYARAVELMPGHVPARLRRAVIALDAGRLDDAAALLGDAEVLAPEDPELHFLQAALAAARGDRAALLEAARRVDAGLKRVDPEFLAGYPTGLLVYAAIAYGNGRWVEAAQKAERFLAFNPNHVLALRLHALAELRLGEPLRAVKSLRRAVELRPEDAELLALLAQAEADAGNDRAAARLLRKAAGRAPGDAGLALRLGRIELRLGRTAAARAALERAAAMGGTAGREAGTALAELALRRGAYQDAERRARGLLERAGDDPVPLNILGAALLGQGDVAGARRAFERALAIEPDYVAAALNLASCDIRDGALDRAAARYAELSGRFPDDVRVMKARAALAERRGDREAAIRWLDKVRLAAPDGELESKLRLLRLYLAAERIDDALALAELIEQRHPDDLQALAAVAQVVAAAGQTERAGRIIGRLSVAAGEDPVRLVMAARLQAASGELAAARATLIKAVQRDVDYLPAQTALGELELRLGEAERALRRAEDLRRRFPGQAAGDRLAGDALLALGRADEAVAAYRRAYERAPDGPGVVRLYRALAAAGRGEEGRALLEERVATAPRDAVALRALAAARLAAGDLPGAIAANEAVLAVRPEDPLALNNLAALYQRSDDPRALAYAERAWRAAPDSAAVLDTYGWILARRGELERAVALLREAAARAAGVPEVQYHLAAVLVKAGRRDEARGLLRQALGSGHAFPGRDHAERLLSGLD